MSTANDTGLATDGLARRGTLARGALAGVCAWLLGSSVAYVRQASSYPVVFGAIGASATVALE